MLKNVKKYGPLVILTLFLVIAHHAWFFDLGIKTNGDWVFFFKSAMTTLRQHYFTIWLSDYSFGRVLSDSGQAPTYALYGFLAQYFGFGYAIAERIVHLWPVVIFAPMTSYFLVLHTVKGRVAAIAGALVYSTNTYFLTLQTGHLTLAAAYAIVPVVILFYIRMLESFQLKYVVLSGLALTACSAYEPRAAYLTLGMLFLYAVMSILTSLTNKNFKRTLKIAIYSAGPVVLFLFLNIYWILGLSQAADTTGVSGLSSGLFGTAFFDLRHALTLMQPYWNFHAPIAFIVNPIPSYFWLIPLFAFIGLYKFRANKNVMYFGVIGLIGVLLTKQVDAPFTHLYGWLFNNLPGFNAFRESSKFYFLISLSYSVLLAAFVSWLSRVLEKRDPKFRAAIRLLPILVVSLLFLPNTIPLFSGSIGTTFATRNVPNDYKIFNKFISTQNDYFRIYWMPKDSRFSLDTATHPRVDSPTIIDSAWKDYFPNANTLPSKIANVSVAQQSFSNALMDISSIKYVVIPIQDNANDDNFFTSFGHSRKEYISAMDNISYLKRVNIGTRSLIVYRNMNYKPYVTALTNTTSIPSYTSFEKYYDFNVNALKQSQMNYIPQQLAQANPNEPNVNLTDLFDDINRNSLDSSGIDLTQHLDPNKQNVLYADMQAPSFSYSVNNNSFLFTQYINNSLNLNGIAGQSTTNTQTYALNDKSNILAVGNTLYDIDTTSKTSRNIGATNESVNLFSNVTDNLVSSTSFLKNTWGNSIDHCDNSLAKSASTTPLSSDFVVKFKSKSVVHCTQSQNFDVSTLSYLRISYRYKIKEGQRAGYRITFNDSSTTSLNDDQLNTSTEWHDFSSEIKVPVGATQANIQLYGYPDDHNQNITYVNYDRVNVNGMVLENTLAPARVPNYSQVNIGHTDTLKLSYSDSSISKNLLPNSSFEKSLWQKDVGDCNNYDKKPIINMSLSNDATAGAKSLQLSAKRHIACTTPGAIKVKEGTDYNITFDYKNVTDNAGGYSITFNDPSGTRVEGRLQPTNSGWNNFSHTVRVPHGATSMTLTVLSFANEDQSSYEISRYDNFNVVSIPSLAGRYFLTSETKSAAGSVRSISSRSENSTTKDIMVKGARGRFYINMSEQYNSNWQLQLDENTKKNENLFSKVLGQPGDKITTHTISNDFMNLWYVNTADVCKAKSAACIKQSDGSYNIHLVVTFNAQRFFNIGLLISVLTLFLSLAILGRAYIRPSTGKTR